MLVLMPIFLVPTIARAACSFSRDLQNGSTGEDVRCLQKYLNSAGYIVAQSGVGSPGNETSLLRDLTVQAIKKWQTANGVTATGYFGSLSRQKYSTLTAIVTASPAASANQAAVATVSVGTPTEIQAKISAILAQIDSLKAQREKASKDKITAADAKSANNDVKSAIDSAHSEVDAAYRDHKSVDTANGYLKNAENKLADAKKAYNNGNYDQSVSLSDEAQNLVNNALREIGSNTVTKSSAKSSLDDAETAIKGAQDKVDAAENEGKNIDVAQNKINDAQTNLNTANNYYDNKDYTNAITYSDKANNLAEDAINAIEKTANARTYINNAETYLDSAKSAALNQQSTNTSNYLADAKNYINKAVTSLDASTYEEAIDYLYDARNDINDAKNYLTSNNYDKVKSCIAKAVSNLEDALDEF